MFSSIPLERPIEFVNVQPLQSNPLISKTRVKIAYHGKNRNGSYIDKQTMTNMAVNSLALTPIVGRFLADKNDFADHSIETVVTPDGELGRIRRTKAFGVVPENPNIAWEWFLDEDGVEREYLTADAFLWTGRYPETLRIIEEGDNNQSMEIDPETVVGNWSQIPNSTEMSFVITEANFLGLCVLGADVEPCFEGASFQVVDFNLEERSLEQAILGEEKKQLDMEKREFMKELEFALNNDPSIVSVAKMDNEEDITEVQSAITDLDIAADSEPNPHSVEAIDKAIDTLLAVEQNLDREDVVVPNTEDGAEALSEMEGGPSDITSGPNFDNNQKATPVIQPFEEEEEMSQLDPNMLNQAEKPVVEPQVPPVAPAPAVAPVAQPAPAPRVSAEEKRAQMAANGQEASAAEKMQDVIRAMQEMEQLKAALQELIQTSGIEVPGQPAPAQPVAPSEEGPAAPIAKGGKEEDPEDKKKKEFADKEEEKEPVAEPAQQDAPVAPTPEGDTPVEPTNPEEEEKKKEFAEDLGRLTQDRKEEGASKATQAVMAPTTPDVKKGEMTSTTPDVSKGEMTPTTPPEGATNNPGVLKKKDKNITSYEADEKNKDKEVDKDEEIKRLNAQLASVTKELAFAKDENKALKEFKVKAEEKEKEDVLKEFSFLPQEEQAKLRAEFANFSKEDLEAKCALIAYRSGVNGQNVTNSTDIVSYSHEGVSNVSEEEQAIIAEFARIKQK